MMTDAQIGEAPPGMSQVPMAPMTERTVAFLKGYSGGCLGANSTLRPEMPRP